MKIVETLAETRAWLAESRPAGELGLVPTMGYLHEGHLSLLRRARAENGRVAATIFANPAQFDKPEDLASYPRDIPRDTAMLREAGCDLVLAPPPGEIYLPGHQTWVEVGDLSAPLEGARRPGHFRGVATVVLKLFGIFQPDRAYFGQKDAQQLAVIRRMARDLNQPVEVVGCPTVREPDGLAMSSRNARLGPEERVAAGLLFRALSAARAAWQAGETEAETLRRVMRSVLAGEPLVEPEYVSVADPLTLAELERAEAGAILSMAVNVGRARLIDNLILPPRGGAAG